ncbi:MAG: NIPSNAP family protein [Rhodospirillales bacterium]
MPEIFDVTVVALRPGTNAAALKRLGETLAAPGARGRLLACWYSDIGALNQIMVVRGFASERALSEDRKALALGGDPFGLGDIMAACDSDRFVPFDFVPPMRPGKVGPVFEVRTYLTKPDGLAGTVEIWRKHLPARLKLSPILTAMHALGGATPRFMHVWPYPDMNARQAIRAEAVKQGVWPPPGGAGRLQTMRSDIYFAADFSPIR